MLGLKVCSTTSQQQQVLSRAEPSLHSAWSLGLSVVGHTFYPSTWNAEACLAFIMSPRTASTITLDSLTQTRKLFDNFSSCARFRECCDLAVIFSLTWTILLYVKQVIVKNEWMSFLGITFSWMYLVWQIDNSIQNKNYKSLGSHLSFNASSVTKHSLLT